MTGPLSTNEEAWAAASGWNTSDRMNEIEALLWRSERHPRLSSTITSVLIYDQVPDWDRFFAAHDWASLLIARCRQRVLEPALPVGPPAWVPDENFQLDYHVRRTRLPAPGGLAALLELAQSLAMTPFDRTRPLWEGTLVEGFDGEKAAYVLKLHHSLTDGMGGIQLMTMVQSRTREHTPNKPLPADPLTARETMDASGLATVELTEQARRVPGVLWRALSMGVYAATHPSEVLSDAVRFAGSMRRTLSPPPAAPSPLLTNRSGTSWKFGVLECGLAELRSAAKAAGGSLNDAYVAALLGGLRRYHDRHGTSIDELPMAMPVSLRKADDPLGGNKFAGAFFAAPVGVEDPAERIATIRGTVLSLRTEPALDTFSMVAPVLNRIPSAVGGFVYDQIGSAADLSASNIPGVPHPVYMAGAKVERLFPFGPLPGVAVMAAMVSHAGVCCFGINMDGSAVQDPDVMMECLDEGLREVLELSTVEGR
ncbi:wax ester/triacylglycerol synthase domain-containing protein [Alloactinosynnema sp. L-07]|uniref:wax ester/triacylglycerol synthase domain-containing protein n=1 Tax=Alloactinosynnema sp. L-07 TaxID=1653480 RepID=UPI0006B49D46|nr:wax ester/triacylglycerol synthase domain-containing protein [Alloactinosynnema sp. L-07]